MSRLAIAPALVSVTLVTLSGSVALAGKLPEEGMTSVTIYSTARPGAVPAQLYRPVPGGATVRYQAQIPGYAVVKDERWFELDRGRSEVQFTDVAALLDPTTVRFESVTDPAGTTVLEQSYRFDLVSRDKLLDRFLDRDIVVEQDAAGELVRHEGRLLSNAGGVVLRQEDGTIRTIERVAGVELPELPGGLITRPTLFWDLESNKGGRHHTRVSYETSGITWWADYNLVFEPGRDANRGTLDVSAWVSILNQSGGSYRDARLKLIAGDVQRATNVGAAVPSRAYQAVTAESRDGFEEKAFFEYHLYTLGRRTTIPDRSTKQIELFDAARGVPADKILLYSGQAQRFGVYGTPMTQRNFGIETNKKVDVYLQFDNAEPAGLGIPLPSGRVRVNQIDPDDGTLEFIGEDVIDHTPRDEEVLIRLGSAFDVVGERVQKDFTSDAGRRVIEEEIEVEIRNHKDDPVEVLVKEAMYRWTNWEILRESLPHDKIDARTIHYPVEVPARGSVKVSYRVRYTW